MGNSSSGAARGNKRPTPRNAGRTAARRSTARRSSTRAGTIAQLQQGAANRQSILQRVVQAVRRGAQRVTGRGGNRA